MSSNSFNCKFSYAKVFKQFEKISSITTVSKAEAGGYTCVSPFTGEAKAFRFSAMGWQDSSTNTKGTISDLIADLAELERDSIDVVDIVSGLGIDLSQHKKLCYSMRELQELDLPIPETWLGGFVSEGEATLVVALPGVGKTWFTLAIALCLASGRQRLGPWQTKAKKRTLIVDFEMGAMRLKQRLQDLKKGYALLDVEDEVGLLCPELCSKAGVTFTDLGHAEQVKILFEILADYDLVIIDNVNAAYPSASDDENSPKFWVQPQSLVMAIRQSGKACIMVHHSTKGDPKNPAGSGKNVRFFDNVLAMVDVTDYSKTDTKRVKFHIRKSRNFPLSRESQPELELREFQGGVYWAETNNVMDVLVEKQNKQFLLNSQDTDDIPW